MVFLITGIASTFCVPLYDKAKASKGARVGNRKSKGGKDDQKHERKKEKKRKAIKKGKKKKRGRKQQRLQKKKRFSKLHDYSNSSLKNSTKAIAVV